MKIVSTVLAKEGIHHADVSVVFVNDARIKRINTRFLRHSSITDVITFTLETQPLLQVELYINLQQAKRQAKQYGVSVKNEVTRLIVHGVLHAAGYDDTAKRSRHSMVRKQEQYVALVEASAAW